MVSGGKSGGKRVRLTKASACDELLNVNVVFMSYGNGGVNLILKIVGLEKNGNQAMDNENISSEFVKVRV